jgi:hypothetical protein
MARQTRSVLPAACLFLAATWSSVCFLVPSKSGASLGKSPITRSAVATASAIDTELEFAEGQRVVIQAPPGLRGKQGEVLKHIPTQNAFSVRLDSGSVFNIIAENLQGASGAIPAAAPVAAAPVAVVRRSNDDDEPAFAEGQRVVILGPPAMKGTQATVVAPVRDYAFSVRLDSGSVFNILTDNLQDASGAPVPTAAAPSPLFTRKAADEDEPAFEEGEPVTILAPPALQGTNGIVVKHLPIQDSFAVRLASGSVFNIFTENLKKA